jgi:hypothetical protein
VSPPPRHQNKVWSANWNIHLDSQAPAEKKKKVKPKAASAAGPPTTSGQPTKMSVDRANALLMMQSVGLFLCCAVTFQSLLASKRNELSKMPLDDMHPSQVHELLHTVNITSDVNVLVTNSVTGGLLSSLTSEVDMKEILAINEGGNCTRLVQLVRHMISSKGIPTPANIYTDGKDNDPSTWSVQQLAAHLAKNPALKDVQELFMQHKLAGDVIKDMNESEVASVMELPPTQRLAFKSEIVALRKIIQQQSLLGRLISLCVFAYLSEALLIPLDDAPSASPADSLSLTSYNLVIMCSCVSDSIQRLPGNVESSR